MEKKTNHDEWNSKDAILNKAFLLTNKETFFDPQPTIQVVMSETSSHCHPDVFALKLFNIFCTLMLLHIQLDRDLLVGFRVLKEDVFFAYYVCNTGGIDSFLISLPNYNNL